MRATTLSRLSAFWMGPIWAAPTVTFRMCDGSAGINLCSTVDMMSAGGPLGKAHTVLI